MANKFLQLLITLLGGWFGLHKFLSKKYALGILYFFTCGLFGIGWLVDSIKATIAIFSSSQKNVTGPDTVYEDSIAKYNEYLHKNEIVSAAETKYYSGMEEIESMWSVMYNLKITTGPKAEAFESKCYDNIFDLYEMMRVEKQNGYAGGMPTHVPAYVRLAMLYEKQENYQKAIDICVAAIKAGAINDGNKGKMYGRLARLIKKSGLPVNTEIAALISQQPK